MPSKLAPPAIVVLLAFLPVALGGAGQGALAQDAGPDVPAAPAPCMTPDAPCGYITPVLDLNFVGKPRCPGVPGTIDPAKCVQLPGEGKTLVFNGTVRWYWKESEDLSYPLDPNQPVVITFGATPTDPKWLPFDVEPESYTITSSDILDPRNRRTDNSSSSPVVYFWFERPVTVTFRLEGEPSGDALQLVRDRHGIQPVYVKAKGTGSGAFYKEAFGGEEFRFNATAYLAPPVPPPQQSPPGAWVAAVAIAVALVVRRAGHAYCRK